MSKDDAICPKCKLKLIFKCPRCNSLTRLGSVRCKDCGYTFVKFCPECKTANYATSSVCRKCGYEFESEIALEKEVVEQVSEEPKKKIINLSENKTLQTKIKQPQEEKKEEKPLLFYIDFINLEKIFEKYNKKEFEREVIQNIRTTIKIAFGCQCDFINSHVVVFKFNYTKSTKILDKINQFEEEFAKFNQILEKKLDSGLSYKFALTTEEEVKEWVQQEIEKCTSHCTPNDQILPALRIKNLYPEHITQAYKNNDRGCPI